MDMIEADILYAEEYMHACRIKGFSWRDQVDREHNWPIETCLRNDHSIINGNHQDAYRVTGQEYRRTIWRKALARHARMEQLYGPRS